MRRLRSIALSIRRAILPAIGLAAFLLSGAGCVHVEGMSGDFDAPGCSADVILPDSAPGDARWAIERACARFEAASELASAGVLDGVEVRFVRNGQFDVCEPIGGSCATPTVVEIDMRHDHWRAALMHEISHVLMHHTRPDLAPEDHHRWMMDNGLCYRGCEQMQTPRR